MMLQSRAYIEKYKVTVREPGWERAAMFWEEFATSQEAEEFIKDIAPTYPEGTLLFVTAIWGGSPRWAPHGMTSRKAFIVNEYGEAVRRKGGWVPEGAIAREWIKEPLEVPPKPEEPEISRGYGPRERLRLWALLRQLGLREADDIRKFEEEQAEYERKAIRSWFRPAELGGAEQVLRKMLGKENA